MVSVNPNIAQGFPFFDPMNMGLPGLHTLPHPVPAEDSGVGPVGTVPVTGRSGTMSFTEDPTKKIRKPYTITKSRESWTDQEHDKFLEALQLFDRDWKKIEAFVGSKTVIQIRSHAQKYFLKVQKSGTSEHVPPPRPKRKASHPYPQKAPKNAALMSTGSFPSSTPFLEPGYLYRPDSSSVLGNPVIATPPPPPPWKFGSVQAVNRPQPVIKDELEVSAPVVANNCCYSSSNADDAKRPEPNDKGSCEKSERVIPDFAQVYSFIGSVFDPNTKDHVGRLKQMDPINLETVLLLMKNLSVNLRSPEFEEHRKLLSSYKTGATK